MKTSDVIKNRQKQNFMADLQMAQKVEEATCVWLDSLSIFKNIRIVNQKGHDLQFLNKHNELRKIEIKRDFWIDAYQTRKATDNICVELWSNFNCGNPGWIYYSDSDYIYYIGNQNIYIIDTPKLKSVTNSLIEIGVANKIEPILKKECFSNIAKIQYTAHHNGNFKVRSVLVKKQFLFRQSCIVRIIDRAESGFDLIAKNYQI